MTFTTSTDSDKFVNVGVDLAKKVFQVAYKDPVTGKFINKQLKRNDFQGFIEDQKGFRKHIFMEACGSSYFWCRKALEFGHLADIIPATATRTFVLNNKSDINDAKAIWQLSFVPDVKKVRVRSEENQVLGIILKIREKLIAERTKLCNWMRGQFYELGFIASLGTQKVGTLLEEVKDKIKDKEWSDEFTAVCDIFKSTKESIENNIKTIENYITTISEKKEICQKLMTIPYVGPINAVAIAYVMEDPKFYKNGRQFAAYAGFAPKHTGTGGETKILGVKDQGNSILKRTLFQAALSMYSHYKSALASLNKNGELDLPKVVAKAKTQWFQRLSLEFSSREAACAIANKMARTAWAVVNDNKGFNKKLSTLFISSLLNESLD